MTGDDAAARSKMLIQTANNSVFDPARTARAITPLLMELPDQAVYSISKELDQLLTSNAPELRSAAVVLKVRTGAPLDQLAKQDPAALLSAVTSLTPDTAPANVPDDLLDLVEAGALDPGVALPQAARLSRDHPALFKRLSAYVDEVADVSYEQWGDKHKRAMGALAAMHRVSDEDWPDGYGQYRIARADPAVLDHGWHVFHEEETGCIRCHGNTGRGGGGYPPLAGSPWVLGSPLRAAAIVKYGMEGELQHLVNPESGELFGQPGVRMEPMSHLSEADIAAVLTYVRNSWGNFASPVTIEHVTRTKQADTVGDDGMYQHTSLVLKRAPFRRDTVLGSTPLKIDLVHWSPPGAGLVYMLGAVTLTMLLILLGTYYGGGLPAQGDAHNTPAIA